MSFGAVMFAAKWAYFETWIESDWVASIDAYFNLIETTQHREQSFDDDRDVFQLSDNVLAKIKQVVSCQLLINEYVSLHFSIVDSSMHCRDYTNIRR